MAAVLKRLGITCLRVRDENRDIIISQISAVPSESGTFTFTRHDILTPLRLARRTFWLSDTITFSGKLTKDQWLDLLKLKAGYEEKHGYDWMHGKDSVTIAAEEYSGYSPIFSR